MLSGVIATLALPLSTAALKHFNEVFISIFCLILNSVSLLMVGLLGVQGDTATMVFFYMAIFTISGALNMYFMVVELRVLPNVFG